jgi:protein O-mannosyl-transferase
MARSRFPVWLMAALLVLGTMALYWPATRCDFVNLDDDLVVTSNVHVQNGLTLENLKWAFFNPLFINWHPLTALSHMLDCQLFGLQPWGHHLTSVSLHALNAALVLLFLRRTTGAIWRSVVVAALFAVHPLRVESVAWVAERKDVLSGFFGLLALIAYARYAELQGLKSKVQSPKPVVSDHRLRYYVLSLFFLACGLMSKPMLVTWPFVMLLLDYWPLERFKPGSVWRLVREKIPFVALAAVMTVVTFVLQKQGGALEAGETLPLGVRSANAVVSYCRYLGTMFWPRDLAVFYPHPGQWPAANVLLAGGLLVGVSALLFVKRRRYPFLLMGWLWYGGTLVPVIGLVQTGAHAMADRFTYLPSLGVLILVVWGVYELSRHWRYGMIALSLAVTAAIVLCLALTRQQLGYWKDSEALFRHALEVTENNDLAHNNLGTALDQKGQTDEAIRQYREAIRLKPDYALPRNNLGAALDKKGQTDEAIRQYREAIRLKPDYAVPYNNLGNDLGKQGQVDAAISHYREAIRLKPDYAEAHYNLGLALNEKSQIDEAISHYQEVVRLKPDYAEAYNNLGAALARKGPIDEAIRQYQKAIRLKPDYAQAHYNLGLALVTKGQLDEAVGQYEEAIRLKPDYAEACNNLGLALVRRGQMDEAIRQYQEAIRLKPDYAFAHFNLANAFQRNGRIDDSIMAYEAGLELKSDEAEAQYRLAALLLAKGRLEEAIRHFHQALSVKPDYAEALGTLAGTLDGQGRYSEAVRCYQAALQARPDQTSILNNLAWLLASCPEAAFRNGPEAVRLASRACELTRYGQPLFIGTLAAAQAEAGDFPAAIATAERAAALATELRLEEIAAKNRELLLLYRQGRPFHERKGGA